MKLEYKITTTGHSLRTIHVITIEDETLATTRSKEILTFAKARNLSKLDWKELKEAVRLGNSLTINGGA